MDPEASPHVDSVVFGTRALEHIAPIDSLRTGDNTRYNHCRADRGQIAPFKPSRDQPLRKRGTPHVSRLDLSTSEVEHRVTRPLYQYLVRAPMGKGLGKVSCDKLTTSTAAGGSMASRHRRHGLPSSRTRSRALHGSRHPQPRDQRLHSSNKRGYFQYPVPLDRFGTSAQLQDADRMSHPTSHSTSHPI